MDELYTEDKAVYDSLPKDMALNKLLKDARTKDIANKGIEVYHWAVNGGLGPTTAPPSPTSGASIPSGGGTRMAGNPVNNGNYSKTEGMKRLWKVAGGGTDEDMALMQVLKERGFYE